MAAALLVAGCGSDAASGNDVTGTTAEAGDRLLGTPRPATKAPISIGFITDGAGSAAVDHSNELLMSKATVKWLNEYRGGLAGHKIELTICDAGGDVAKSGECATQMIQKDVTVVVGGQLANDGAVWQPLHDAGVPLLLYGATDAGALTDTASTFSLVSSIAIQVEVPSAVAKADHVTKVRTIVVDVPAAVTFYKTIAKNLFAERGITDFGFVAVPPGTADFVPVISQLGQEPGVISIIGNSAFVIGVLRALGALGIDTPVTSLSEGITDAVRKAIPATQLEGLVMSATTPVGDDDDKGIQLFKAVAEKFASGHVDLSQTDGLATFNTITALALVLEDFSGEVTSESIVRALKSAPQMPLLAGGGLEFRCNGKAVALTPAACSRGTLMITLGPDSRPTAYKVVGNTPIPD
ncbi:hypothetical protein BCD48_27705 [Pseudofrankia sp. BMG5.36]|nr:hypothetical protein BCD48_27705 [Pseudofrankia sp. BMG5.36]